jgi:hypothetical protein
MTGRGKRRKTKTRFPFVFPRPWKSLRDFHIPTAPTASPSMHPKNNQENHRKEPQYGASLISSFRLILGLENALRVLSVSSLW